MKKLAAVLVGATLLLGACSVSTAAPEPVQNYNLAELMASTIDPDSLSEFCENVAYLGDGPAFAAFEEGYGNTTTPTAREVYDAIEARC